MPSAFLFGVTSWASPPLLTVLILLSDLLISACRGYPANKITENVECEIMQVIAEEAQDSYK